MVKVYKYDRLLMIIITFAANMIVLKNITKQFHQKNREITALSDVSLTVPKGKIYGVIGASGAGKSTLIRCVNLLERPTSGEVIVDGLNLIGLSPSLLAKERRQIGMIFQHFNLLSSRTVSENIAFPLELDKVPKEQIEKRVAELLALVGWKIKEKIILLIYQADRNSVLQLQGHWPAIRKFFYAMKLQVLWIRQLQNLS
ncbi:ATP-binding cassette domain-containing protein [Pedobacter sp. NJ-S-72]